VETKNREPLFLKSLFENFKWKFWGCG